MTAAYDNLPSLRDADRGQENLFARPLAESAPAPVTIKPTPKPRRPRETLTVLLADAGGPDDPPLNSRLRMALKTLGRRYKLRCKAMSETKGGAA